MRLREVEAHSAGVLFNEEGELIGFSNPPQAKVARSSGTVVIRSLINQPIVTVSEAPSVAWSARENPIRLSVRLEFPTPPDVPPQVQAKFIGDWSGEREARVEKISATEYSVTGSPVLPGAFPLQPMIRVQWLGGPSGVVTSHINRRPVFIRDRQIQVGETTDHISALSVVRPGQGVATRRNGTKIEGKIGGLEDLPLYSEGTEERVVSTDLSKQTAVSFLPAGMRPENVVCRVTVSGATYSVAKEVPVPVEGPEAPLLGEGDPTRPSFDPYANLQPSFEGDRVEVKFPGEITDVRWGGGGRYLVAHLGVKNHLEVIDCLSGQRLGLIPMREGGVFGVGANAVLVAHGSTLERWSLSPFKRESEPKHWAPGSILGLVVGSRATQWVGVLYDALDDAGFLIFEYRDIFTGEPIHCQLPTQVLPQWLEHSCPSGDGYTLAFGFRPGAVSKVIGPNGSEMTVSDMQSSRWTIPGPDGRIAYLGTGEARLVDFPHSVLSSWEYSSLIPIGIRGLAIRLSPIFPRSRQDASPLTLSVVDVLSDSELVTNWVSLNELDPSQSEIKREQADRDPLRLDRRCSYSGQLGILCTIPLANRSVVIRKLNLWETLKAANTPYLYLTSDAPPVVASGKAFKMALHPVTSSEAQIAWKVLAGPEGLNVDPQGTLSWAIPASAKGKSIPVILRASTDEGQSQLWDHTFFVR